MNAQEFIDATRNRLGIRSDDPILTDAQILEEVNFALQAITSKRPWPWLYTEVTGTATSALYPLPATHSSTVFITVNGVELISAGLSDLARFRGQTGEPRYFSIAGNNFNFTPMVADDASWDVVHGYYRTEPALVADADEPLLPEQFSEWVVLEAAVRLSSRTNRQDRVALWREEAARVEKDALKFVDRSAGAPRIKRTRPSHWQDVY